MQEECLHYLVEVHWLDADTSAGWTELSTKKSSPVLVISRGLLAGEDKHFVTLAISHDEDSDTYLSPHRIPKDMIRKFGVISADTSCSSTLHPSNYLSSKQLAQTLAEIFPDPSF